MIRKDPERSGKIRKDREGSQGIRRGPDRSGQIRRHPKRFEMIRRDAERYERHPERCRDRKAERSLLAQPPRGAHVGPAAAPLPPHRCRPLASLTSAQPLSRCYARCAAAAPDRGPGLGVGARCGRRMRPCWTGWAPPCAMRRWLRRASSCGKTCATGALRLPRRCMFVHKT